MKKSKITLTILSILTLFAMAVNFSSCTGRIHAEDLMGGIKACDVTGKDTDDSFIMSQSELALRLFKATADKNRDENLLISPLSIQLALAMTANGADGKTLTEMEKLLGGEIPIETLNEYLYTYVKNLSSNEKAKLNIANSIWFRDSEELHINEDFLQTNADYYGASAYKAPFNKQTVKDINNWVDKNTDGMIDKVIDEIDEHSIMFLINALLFEAEWIDPYTENSVRDGSFTSISGEDRNVQMMSSSESKYISDEKATGFIKRYSGGKYSFVAILPNEGVDLYDYIDSLTADGLQSMLREVKYGEVATQLPKFSYDCDYLMNDILKDLGMPSAFGDDADFSKLGSSDQGNIYIDRVIHKTSIKVAEKGTKAGAVTMVAMNGGSSMPSEIYHVTLDRPFVYIIIDSSNNLPIFMGAVTDIKN